MHYLIHKAIQKFSYYLNIFIFYFFDPDFKNLIKNLPDNFQKINKNKIIFDNFESFPNTCFRMIYLPYFAKYFDANLVYFNLKFNPIYKTLYNKIFAQQIIIKLSGYQKKELFDLTLRIFNKIKTKEDVLNITIDNLNMGIDIYESYLITYKKPTIETISNNLKLKKMVIKAITYYIFWRDFVKKNKVVATILSHRCYVETNILNKISIANNIPVFTLSGKGDGINRWSTNKLYLFNYYPKIFKSLSHKEKKFALKKSMKQISKRFKGIVGVDMSYSLKSAFSKNKKNNKVFDFDKKSNVVNILICTHCFYDNPHAYGKIFFPDFYEWLIFLSKIEKKTNYRWFIKPHPDYLPGTMENIKKIIKNFNHITLIDPSTSFHELKGKIDKVITVYGSVAHELPLLGFEVINCTNTNPHAFYNFSYTPKNIKSLESKLLNLKLGNPKKIDNKKIYEFYYIHNHYFKYNLFDNTFYSKNNIFNLKKFNNFISISKNKKIIEKKIFDFLHNKKIMTMNDRKLSLLNKIKYKH